MGRDYIVSSLTLTSSNFNPRAPCGARRQSDRGSGWWRHFNPRAPCGARPGGKPGIVRITIDFNPRAPCGARLHTRLSMQHTKDFNPRAPCGARLCRFQRCILRRYFNPRAPCGARRAGLRFNYLSLRFQSTRPVWGATLGVSVSTANCWAFQSTRPVWGATLRFPSQPKLGKISIHAPRVGRDRQHHRQQRQYRISIHAPRVGRDPPKPRGFRRRNGFQSTRPVWGATLYSQLGLWM